MYEDYERSQTEHFQRIEEVNLGTQKAAWALLEQKWMFEILGYLLKGIVLLFMLTGYGLFAGGRWIFRRVKKGRDHSFSQ